MVVFPAGDSLAVDETNEHRRRLSVFTMIVFRKWSVISTAQFDVSDEQTRLPVRHCITITQRRIVWPRANRRAIAR